MKRKKIILGVLIVLMAMNAGLLYGAEYIDVTVRLDDYWAEVVEFGGGEPTWHSYFSIGSSYSSTNESGTMDRSPKFVQYLFGQFSFIFHRGQIS